MTLTQLCDVPLFPGCTDLVQNILFTLRPLSQFCSNLVLIVIFRLPPVYWFACTSDTVLFCFSTYLSFRPASVHCFQLHVSNSVEVRGM